MIKVEKDLSDVPESLNSDLTNQRRDEIIKAGEYPTDKKLKENPVFEVKTLSPYNDRYKCQDVKDKLKTIYNHKCVYCEQSIERCDVEHYRPKSIYYWLAYSWDNLLYCCSPCNTNKGNRFKVARKVTINDYPIKDIHNLRDIYDSYESPKFINPEKEDIYLDIIYEKNGFIHSNDDRTQYTITECKLDRGDLNDRRFQVFNSFKKKVDSRIEEKKNGDAEAVIKLRGLIEDFIKDSDDPIKDFISFRKYIIKNWLRELVDELS